MTQQQTSKRFKFLVARPGGHHQIVSQEAPSRAEADRMIRASHPGASFETYRTRRAIDLGATPYERRYPSTEYEIGSAFDPDTWMSGDIVVNSAGDRMLVTSQSTNGGYVGLLHISDGGVRDRQLSLHAYALDRYGYRRMDSVVPDAPPATYDSAPMPSPIEDSTTERRALVENA